MSASRNYGHKPITLVVIAFLVMMLVDGWTTTVTFDVSSTTLRSSSMKKPTVRFLRQPHREKYEIVKDILSLLLAPDSKSVICRRSSKRSIGDATGLPHGITVKYLRSLANQDLLRISQESGPYAIYEITEKGLRYLQIFAEIEDDLRPC
jgi:predicted transcriptional regulator